MVHKCIIIGSGPAGYTAAIYAARAGLSPVLYTGKEPGGQLMITNEVENYPGFPDGVMGPEMMNLFIKQAERFGTDIRYELIDKVDFSGPIHKLWTDQGTELEAHTVIISTGASAKWLGIPSEAKLMNKGVSACAVCDGFFFRGKDVAVVGAGDTACEEAHYLSKLCKKVYLIVRRDEMRASKIMQERVLNTPNIEVIWNAVTDEILGEEEVTGARLKNTLDGSTMEIDINAFFKDWLDMDEIGYLIASPGSAKTNREGVFVSGDAQDKVYRQAITAAGTGCMAALDAERYLSEKGIV